ncbi:hypothetical protein [Lentisalinibacter sediminis]|uniref:hypothetical protein n=1 Tax=Lentisalinibacter sediminis TaxID=2992237 RepID=UPI003869AD10
MKSRLIVYAALVGLLTVLVIAWMMRGDSGTEPHGRTPAPVANTAETSERDSSSPQDMGEPDSSSAVADAQSSKPSALAITRQEAWERERGYMSAERTHLRSLDEGQLQELIAQGNTAAITTLAGRYLTIDPRKMMELYEQAAVLGSTSALVSASSVWASPWISQNVSTMRVSDNPPVNMLAMLLAAQLRGDNVLVPRRLQQLKTDYSFTEAEIAEACAGAVRLYRQLEARRLALGQNYFDNTPSPLGQEYEEGNHIGATCGEPVDMRAGRKTVPVIDGPTQTESRIGPEGPPTRYRVSWSSAAALCSRWRSRSTSLPTYWGERVFLPIRI